MNIRPLIYGTLAEDLPAGPLPGQFEHKKGSRVAYNSELKTKRFGLVTFVAPDPVFFYLNKAEKSINIIHEHIIEIENSKKTILFPKHKVDVIGEQKIYNFMEDAIAAIIFLFGAVEAFTNLHMPIQATYSVRCSNKNGKVVVFLNKLELEKYCCTNDKLIFLADHFKIIGIKKQNCWNTFQNINRIRNNIMHLKTYGKASHNAYLDTYCELIDVEHDALFRDVKKLLEIFIPTYFSLS